MSLFDNKSGQHVGDNSTAVQVAGNAVIGNTTTEVVTICELVIRSQMASLKEEAYKLVKERAAEFGNQIGSQLSQSLDEQLTKKLADPDIQYSINQAVTQVARKGFNEKSELLKELIVSKINNNNEEDDLRIDHALEITPKLSTNDIKFLALVYYLRNTSKILNGINITFLAERNENPPEKANMTTQENHDFHKNIYSDFNLDYAKILNSIQSLKKINKDLLSIHGVVFTDKFYTTPCTEILGKRTGIKSFANDEAFFEAFPALKYILSAFGINDLKELDSLVMTPIGHIVAENYLRALNFL